MHGAQTPASVLFVCTMNAVRSPMAAALLRHLVGQNARIESAQIDSAGVEAGPVDPLAVEVMREIGIALCSHQPRRLADLKPGAYDLVVTLSREAEQGMADVGAAREYWPLSDPTGVEGSREQRLAAYRAVRDELSKKLNSRFMAHA